MQISIRPYTDRDFSLCLKVFESNCPGFFAREEKEQFSDWLTQKDVPPYFVVEIDDELLACGGIYLSKEANRVSLAWGMVHADWHKKGLGTRLTRHRLDIMDQQYENREQWVETSQLTAGFYERMGFNVMKVTKGGFSPDFDKYEMVRKSVQS